jgi:hypothetical protein
MYVKTVIPLPVEQTTLMVGSTMPKENLSNGETMYHVETEEGQHPYPHIYLKSSKS